VALRNSTTISLQASIRHSGKGLDRCLADTYSKPSNQASSISDVVVPRFNYSRRAPFGRESAHNLVADVILSVPDRTPDQQNETVKRRGWKFTDYPPSVQVSR